MKSILPVATIVAAIFAIWTAAVVPMNVHLTADLAARQDIAVT